MSFYNGFETYNYYKKIIYHPVSLIVIVSDQEKTKISHKEPIKEVGRLKEKVEKYKIKNQTISEQKRILCEEKPPILANQVSKILFPGPREVEVQIPLPAAKAVTPPDHQSPSILEVVSPRHSSAQVSTRAFISISCSLEHCPSSHKENAEEDRIWLWK